MVIWNQQFRICEFDSPVPTLDKVTVDLMVVLGTTTMPVHQVMRLSRGAIIELDATEADEVKILANNLPIASGVVLVDRNRFAVEEVETNAAAVAWHTGKPFFGFAGIPNTPVSRPCPSIPDLLHRRRRSGLRRKIRRRSHFPSARGGIGRRAALRWR